MKKSFLIIGACLISIIIFQAFTTYNEPHFKNLQVLPKDISGHDLDSVMHHFTVALGVHCTFCHVRNEAEKKMDFASDDKPEKNIARKMMLMSIDINKNYLRSIDMDHDMEHDMDNDHDSTKSEDHDMNREHKNMDTTAMNAEPALYMLQTVTCYTCHRGDAHPETKPPKQERPQMPPQMPQKPTDNK